MKKSTLFTIFTVSIIPLIPALAIPFEERIFCLVNFSILPRLDGDLRPSTFNITTDIDRSERALRFVLETNDDLISEHAYIHNLDVYGQSAGEGAIGSALYLTKGSVWIENPPGRQWENVGWARLAVTQEKEALSLDGTFTVSSSQYEVWQEAQEDGPAKIIARKRESSFPTGNRLSLNSTCATTPEDVLNKRQLEWNAWGDNLADNIGNTYGCPQTRQIAYVGIATDCTYTASFNSSDSAQRYILNMVNTASVVFENSFNISLSIQNLTMSNAECPTSISALTDWNTACSVGDLNTRLETFSSWRSSINDNNAYWTLLTGCSAGAGQVGVSWIGALCNSGASYSASSANVVARTQSEWQVFAHESAHTFGAVHDCNSQSCGTESSSSQCCPMSSNTCDAGEQYIMNPVSGPGMTRFSPCTIGNVCSWIGSGQVDARCLVESRNGNSTGRVGRCGNGILETGEACDCGNGSCDEQDTGCCDSVTCQWRGGDGCSRSETGTGTGQGRGINGNSRSDSDSVAWIHDHLPLVIGLSAGIGGGLLLLVFGCIICSCRRDRPTKSATSKPIGAN
ncbi:unnamed protein product [Penicillium nalgiovense]|uniref:Peptidase M12B domain-containing protein n=1 Tax=Penicillium nalgiovense TaxID=60175 RepID=A0A9W4HJ97_PENNA|nr:unnamed protein product [Penicillium nalgiovense]CAG7944635.1 unnamed protein product [Penicillium nalgiovense]CAG7970253.1 unnamed protein product [Penicillium nalgiovense]CAG7973538.1 unnamed protein product [Penicillium nalgiovense]CAG7976407.1 unnamed protein product [Penicillium nalgiovense]